jgi:hemoglobin
MDQPPTELYSLLGGPEGCARLARAFYAEVAQDAVLLPIYGPSHRCAIRTLTAFLVQHLGGPEEYTPERWSLSLREAHTRFRIDPAARCAWLACMERALEAAHIEEPARSALRHSFQTISRWLVNRDENGDPLAFLGINAEPVLESAPAACPVHAKMAALEGQLFRIEEIIAAIRARSPALAIALTGSAPAQAYFARDRAAWVSLLALMTGGGPALEEFLEAAVEADPDLLAARYWNGRTLLHGAAGQGSPACVDLLLRRGADPNAASRFGVTPLHDAADHCASPSAGEVVRLLVAGGANVDAAGGTQRCTPLHLAARRGHLAAAAALLTCGANPELQDRRGDTPLERARNCRKREVAALLEAAAGRQDIDAVRAQVASTPLPGGRMVGRRSS